MSRRLLVPLAVLGVAAALGLTACGTERGVSAGQALPDDTTTTTGVPTSTSVTPTTGPATTTPASGAPCTVEALGDAYVAAYGEPGEDASFAVVGCVGGYAAATVTFGLEAPVYVVYRDEDGSWSALNRGVAHVCDDLDLPEDVGAELGCSSE